MADLPPHGLVIYTSSPGLRGQPIAKSGTGSKRVVRVRVVAPRPCSGRHR